MSVTVQPRIDSLLVGDTTRLHLTLLDSAGDPVTGRIAQWVSSDPSKITVDTSGLLTARFAGSAAITVTVDRTTGGAFVAAQWPVATVALVDSLTVTRYAVVRLIPDLRASTGAHLSDRDETWSSSNESIATVSTNGTVTPLGIGRTVIRVANASHTDSTQLVVVHEPVRHVHIALVSFRATAGLPDTAHATCLDTLNRDAVGATIAWQALDTNVLRVAPTSASDRIATIVALRDGLTTLSATCGGRTDTTSVIGALPAARARFAPDTLAAWVGQEYSPTMILVDSSGQYQGGANVTHLTALDSTIVAFNNNTDPVTLIGLKPGSTKIVAQSAEGFSDTATLIVTTAAERLNVYWDLSFSSTMPNYSWSAAQLSLTDSAGAPLSGPRTIFLTTSDTTVAIVVPSQVTTKDTATMRLFIRRPGVAVFTARVDSLRVNQIVIPALRPIGKLQLSATPRVMSVGDIVTVNVVARGLDDGARFYPVVWQVSDSTIARVDPAGIVLDQAQTLGRITALAPGTVTIRPTSGAIRDSFQVAIQSVAPPTIAMVAPATLTPGATVTLTGTGFDPNPAHDTVRVDGVGAIPFQATGTTILFVVPPATNFPCRQTHQALLSVSAAGVVAVDSAPLTVGTLETLAVGQTATLGAGSNACTEVISGGGSYLVAAVNAAEDPSQTTAFDVHGTWSLIPAAAPPPRASISASFAASYQRDSIQRVERIHEMLLTANRDVVRRLGIPAAQWTAVRSSAPQGVGLSIRATVGTLVHIRIPRIDQPNFCSSYVGIDARPAYVGTHSIIFEDVAAPLAGTMDSVYAAVGREFDAVDYPELVADFGDPLVLDATLDRVGKVAMVFSPEVNGFGVGAFVTSCDFYPEAVAPSSNTTELIYGSVATTPGTGYSSLTPQAWRWQIRSELMHEATHLTSFAARLAKGSALESPWLEEATAMAAQEVWSRNFSGATWKGNASYNQTLYCDVRPGIAGCGDRPFSMFGPFALLFAYAESTETRSPFGPTAVGDATWAGSGWSLVRWAIDTYATNEPAFLRALTQEGTLAGASNLVARTGHPLNEMLANWQLALRVQAMSGVVSSDPSLTFASWNVHSIWSGMVQDFPQDFPTSLPSQERIEYGSDFLELVTGLPGGTAAVFDVQSITFPRQLLDVHAPEGGPPPALQLKILRYR